MSAFDSTLLGEMAARLLDRLDAHPDHDEMREIEAVQITIVVCCEEADGDSYTRTLLQSSHESHWQQLGLAVAGRECISDVDQDAA